MHRTLERLDSAASTLVPLAYLTALFLGTASYFAGIAPDIGAAVGISLAIAAELHSFLEQRRMRAASGAARHMPKDDPRHAQLASEARTHLAVLAALVVFSTYNSIQFTASTWHPSSAFLPTWLQIAIRGSVVPGLFLLTGFLSPLTVDASAVLSRAANSMLHKTLAVTEKQWNSRIDHAKAKNIDLAPVAVSLMIDAGDQDGARRVALIAEGLDKAERGERGQMSATILTEETHTAPTPSTDGGTPLGSSNGSGRGGKAARPAILKLTPAPVDYEAAERKIRRALAANPDASIRTLARAAKVSESTTSKYKRIWQAEQAAVARAR